ncbi:MAG: thioredoxin-dependent thiol peroxidase [Prevotellaceae bacterium]|nr:thioredoxin-dependent thiol peroxidase [Prevotellaceae bacterium]
MNNLKRGDKAPDFSAKDQNGNTISLADFKGKKLILYFYPKDNTPGCTAEACGLRDSYQSIREMGYTVIGVSPDSEFSHSNFISKYKLPFSLIADTDKSVAMAYGVWGEKKMYGKTFTGLIRTTFKINKEGFIEDIITKVNTKNHAAQLL